MNAPASALNALQATQAAEVTCAECQSPFIAKRGWGRFCRDGCRNDFHARDRRRKAILARAPQMFEALQAIAAGAADSPGVAAAAIKGLKAP